MKMIVGSGLVLGAFLVLVPMSTFGDQPRLVESLSEGLTLLEERLDRLDTNREEMVKRQTEIEDQLASLKIWIVRRRG